MKRKPGRNKSGGANRRKSKYAELNKRIRRIYRNHRLKYEEEGESPKGFDFHVDQPSWYDRLAWRVSRFIRRRLKLDIPGSRNNGDTVGRKHPD